METKVILFHNTSDSTRAVGVGRCPSLDGSVYVTAVNKAYSKFVSEATNPAIWAVNLKEYQQTLDLLTGPLGKLIKFTKALRKGDIFAAGKAIRPPTRVKREQRSRKYDDFFRGGKFLPEARGSRPPKGVKKPRKHVASKYLADTWLKYHFGVEPLMEDIHNTVKTLGRDFDPIRVVGRGQGQGTYSTYSEAGYNYDWVTGTWSYSKTSELHECKVRIQATARVTNPNAFLASQVGLVNPLSFAWEIIPFSFVVDWFVNVGQMLASMTDFVGMSLDNPQTTVYQVSTRNSNLIYTYRWVTVFYPPPGEGEPVYERHKTSDYEAYGSRTVKVQRSTSIVGPVLQVKPFKGFSTVRGATAVSLLIQQLRGR